MNLDFLIKDTVTTAVTSSYSHFSKDQSDRLIKLLLSCDAFQQSLYKYVGHEVFLSNRKFSNTHAPNHAQTERTSHVEVLRVKLKGAHVNSCIEEGKLRKLIAEQRGAVCPCKPSACDTSISTKADHSAVRLICDTLRYAPLLKDQNASPRLHYTSDEIKSDIHVRNIINHQYVDVIKLVLTKF